MASEKPSIVVVMGSFQLPWHYRFLKTALEKHGYRTVVMNLPSTILEGSTPVPDSLMKDIEAVRQVVSGELHNGHDVVVMAHSQGGQSASVALDGLGKKGTEPGVTHIVFLSCWLVEPGMSGIKKADGVLPDWLEVRDGLQIVKGSAKSIFFNDVPDDLADEAAKFIYPNSANISAAVTPNVAWNDIPSTYVVCEKDCALYPAIQEWVISSCKLPSEIVRLQAGHSPYLSMPDTLAAIVRRAAGESDISVE